MTSRVKVMVAVVIAVAFPVGVTIGHRLETRATGLSVWVGLVLMGVLLLVSGWRGRRVGDEPRCAKCGYILLHLESGRCPECGSEISGANTVTGERRRGWVRVIAGVLLLAAASSLMLRPVARVVWAVPWYQYKPAGLVVDDIDRPGMYRQAMTELQRREVAGGLPEGARHQLIGRTLQEQAPGMISAHPELLDYLLKALIAGQLTKEEKELLLEQACDVTLAVRPVVGEGEQVPLEISFDCRWPRTIPPGLSLLYRARDSRIDGRTLRSELTSGSILIAGLSRAPASIPAWGFGTHMVELDVDLELLHVPRGGPGKIEPLVKRSVKVHGSYQVVSRDEAPAIGLLDSEVLHEQVVAAVKISHVSKRKDGHFYVMLWVTSAPCDLAFDVFVQTDKGEMRAGLLHCAKGQSRSFGPGGKVEIDQAKVNVVLRPNAEVAKQTVDLSAIYSGEIVFPDVVVR